MGEFHPDLADSKALREAIEFLKILRFQNRSIGYRILQRAVTTIEPDLRMLLGLRSSKLNLLMGKLLIRGLRWALKYSPSWKAALIRSKADFDSKLFRSDV